MINLIASLIGFLILCPAPPSHVIEGELTDNSGKPACGVRVCAMPTECDPTKPNVSIPCDFSDKRGRFAIAVEKAGKYEVFYDDSEHGFFAPRLSFFRQPSAPMPEVLLDDVNVRASVNISMLPKNGLLIGKSVDSKTGLPVENMEFIMCHAANPEICFKTSAKDSAGKFTIPTSHVPFTLRIKANGFDDWVGLNGTDKDTPISVAPETKTELSVFLKRSEASTGREISESEKQGGVNLPAPIQMSPANDAVFNYYPRRTKLEWSPVDGAVSYVVEVDFCAGGMKNNQGCLNPQPHNISGNPPTSGITTTTYEFSFVGAQPGRWRVWAIDRQAREGFKSPWRRFVYLK